MVPDEEPPAPADGAEGKRPDPIKPVQVYLPGEKPEEEEEEEAEKGDEKVEEEVVPPIGEPPAPATNAPPAEASSTTNGTSGAKSLLDQTKKLFHSFATSTMEAVSGGTAPSETLKTSDPGTK